MTKNKKLVIDFNRCKGCQLCVNFCSKKALALGKKINKLGYRCVILENEDACVSCGICAEICPDAVIEVWRS